MKTMNRVFLIGHLGSAPELTSSKNGKNYARLRVATERTRLTAEGERESETDWHSVFVWGRLAEICVAYLGKGSAVMVEGHLSYWQEDGSKLYKSAITADEIRFMESPHLRGRLDNSEGARNHNAVAHPA